MGGPCRRATLRPLAGAYILSHWFVYRRALAQLALLARHRPGLLLQAQPQGQPQGLIGSPHRVDAAGGCGALRRCARHCKGRRLVRVVLYQRPRHALQCGYDCLPRGTDSRGAHRHLEHYHRQPRTHQTALLAQRGPAWHTLHGTWRRVGRTWHCCAHRTLRAARAQRQGRQLFCAQALFEHLATVHADAYDWLLVIRSYRDTLYAKSAHGPELARGHLYPWNVHGTRAVRLIPLVQGRSLLLTRPGRAGWGHQLCEERPHTACGESRPLGARPLRGH